MSVYKISIVEVTFAAATMEAPLSTPHGTTEPTSDTKRSLKRSLKCPLSASHSTPGELGSGYGSLAPCTSSLLNDRLFESRAGDHHWRVNKACQKNEALANYA